MITSIHVAALFVQEVAERIFRGALQVAAVAGLPVTSWRVGDPTLTLLQHEAEVLSTRDAMAAALARSAFISTADDDWKPIVAWETYGIEQQGALYSAPTVTIRNDGGGTYILAPGDLMCGASSIGKTFHSTGPEEAVLSPGATVTFDLVADEAGAASSVVTDEIDEIQSNALLGCVIVSSTAAVGRDAEAPAALTERCNDSLGALSPDGPADAYEYVATKPELTGVTDISSAWANASTTTGAVPVYVAGPSGPPSGASITAALNAILLWATPKGSTPTVQAAISDTVNVTATAEGDLPSDFSARIQTAIARYITDLPISDGTIRVSRSAIDAAAHAAVPGLRRLVVSLPSSDTLIALGHKTYPGTITITAA